MSHSKIIADADGAIVDYDAEFLSAGERSALLAELEQVQDRFDRDRVLMYGKTIDSPRLVCAFGDDGLHYRYAGVDRTTHPWTPHLRAARDRIAAACGHPFNYALVNLYRTGDDYIGWHADKVSDLVPGSAIASLSLGAVRPFQLRHKSTDATHEVLLASGSLLVMRGTCQQFYKHALPRRRGVTEPRFNVTFRHVRAG
ncbi:alpha-ketoglutarate-dependent dioxygenase AlkB family protein [Nannocystis punicea]|uniref:Alpha-ketoglutarate-dependent dioxygenase AlkB n=1 Tax=Nannocystis punicea TaxID=2995304 RepID=A0ABY7H071_9BACT|nr:alpha-ketoglutarate-dependent dioxygenase AlkB [Nannocystis poenicansa]WAS92638.1 alpha-ketoglutarate-dependent dioxygenase AlkB [Nannocystis poenicansa]